MASSCEEPCVENEFEQTQNHSISDDKNPMLNSVVVQTLLQVCDLTDLRRFRLVSKLWHDLSLQRWRDEMVIIIGSGNFWELFRHWDEEDKIRFRQRLHWKDLRLLYEAPSISRKPFKKYLMGNWEFPISEESRRKAFTTEESWEDVQSFWGKCGPWMRELTIESPQIQSAEMFRKSLVEDTPNLMSLKLTKIQAFSFGNTGTLDLEKVETQGNLRSISISLRLDVWYRVRIDPDRATLKPIPWFELLLCFPNIQELEWKEFHDFESIHLMNAWNNLLQSGKNVGHKLKIKCSSINQQDDVIGPPCNPSILKDFLRYQHFTFQHLQIRQNHADIDEEILAEALHLQQDTLKSLELSSSGRGHRNIFHNEFQFLSKLSLNYTCIPNFYFLKYTPNLTSFYMGNQSRFSDMKANTRHREMKDVHLENLRCLNLNLEFMINESDSTLKMFSRWMPNVTVLTCRLNTKSFRFVCKRWPGLREIIDLGGVLDNAAITGIMPGKVARLPNITSLKYLREFRTHSCLLSSQSVFGGFLQTANLTCLEVSLSSKTSNLAYHALFMRFGAGVKRSEPGNGYMTNAEYDAMNELLEVRSRDLSKNYGICPQFNPIFYTSY